MLSKKDKVDLKTRVIRHDKAAPLPKSCVAIVDIKRGNGENNSIIRTNIDLESPKNKLPRELDVEGDRREKEVNHLPPPIDSFVQGLITIMPDLAEGHFDVTVTILLDDTSSVTMDNFKLWVINPKK